MKTIKLSELKNMVHKIAKAEIAKNGYYICNYKGERVKVVSVEMKYDALIEAVEQYG